MDKKDKEFIIETLLFYADSICKDFQDGNYDEESEFVCETANNSVERAHRLALEIAKGIKKKGFNALIDCCGCDKHCKVITEKEA